MGRINDRLFLIGLVTIISTLRSSISFGDFEALGVGARPIGMGSAFVALADDVHSVYYNPAGLSQLSQIEFTSGYGKLYWGLDDESSLGNTFIGYVHPLDKLGGIGAGWLSLGLKGLYREDTFILAYGNKLSRSLSAGMSFKLLSKRYNSNEDTEADPLFQEKGYSKIGFSGNLGALYNLTGNVFCGLSVEDIVQPNMSLGNGAEKLPLVVKMGFAYRDKISLINLALDAVYRDGDFNISAGAEKWVSGKSIGVRGGIETGSSSWTNFSLGGSCQASLFQIDYAFIYPLSGLKGTYGSHRFSLTLSFGGPQEIVYEPRAIKPEEPGPEEVPLSEEQKIEEMRAHYYLGIDYYRKGEYEAAIAEFERVLQLRPGHTQSLDLIKRARERMKIKK